ncbi:MAG: hypothetical protein ABSC46_14015 [Candidatus Limnocylindrales bacterium]|jgi:hypothetical protein
MVPNDKEFRDALHEVLARSGLSMRAFSAAMGRDTGYVASLLDPSRPSRARPTPADLTAASDATGISLVELLEALWGIPPTRLARELGAPGSFGGADAPMSQLSADERRLVADFVDLLLARRMRRFRRSSTDS